MSQLLPCWRKRRSNASLCRIIKERRWIKHLRDCAREVSWYGEFRNSWSSAQLHYHYCTSDHLSNAHHVLTGGTRQKQSTADTCLSGWALGRLTGMAGAITCGQITRARYDTDAKSRFSCANLSTVYLRFTHWLIEQSESLSHVLCLPLGSLKL